MLKLRSVVGLLHDVACDIMFTHCIPYPVLLNMNLC